MEQKLQYIEELDENITAFLNLGVLDVLNLFFKAATLRVVKIVEFVV